MDEDWVAVLWIKVQWLIDAINLQPWYLGTTPQVSYMPPQTSRLTIACLL